LDTAETASHYVAHAGKDRETGEPDLKRTLRVTRKINVGKVLLASRGVATIPEAVAAGAGTMGPSPGGVSAPGGPCWFWPGILASRQAKKTLKGEGDRLLSGGNCTQKTVKTNSASIFRGGKKKKPGLGHAVQESAKKNKKSQRLAKKKDGLEDNLGR